MTKAIQQAVTFRVLPEVLFETFLHSRKHSAATGARKNQQKGGWRVHRF